MSVVEELPEDLPEEEVHVDNFDAGALEEDSAPAESHAAEQEPEEAHAGAAEEVSPLGCSCIVL